MRCKCKIHGESSGTYCAECEIDKRDKKIAELEKELAVLKASAEKAVAMLGKWHEKHGLKDTPLGGLHLGIIAELRIHLAGESILEIAREMAQTLSKYIVARKERHDYYEPLDGEELLKRFREVMGKE